MRHEQNYKNKISIQIYTEKTAYLCLFKKPVQSMGIPYQVTRKARRKERSQVTYLNKERSQVT